MYPVLFQIGGIKIYSYGFMLSMTFVVGALLLQKELVRKKLDPELVGPIILLAIVFGLFGAKLFDVFEYWDRFIQDPVKVFMKGSGLTFLGGFLVGSTAVLLYLKAMRVPLLTFVDAVAPALMVGYGVARIGCQLSGDGDYGIPTDLPWGMAYPHGTVPTTQIVHPTPVYETLYAFAFGGLLWTLRKRPMPAGTLFFVYLIMSSLARFSVEFIRVNPAWMFGFSQSQLLSLLLALTGVVGLLLRRNAPIDSGETPAPTVPSDSHAR